MPVSTKVAGVWKQVSKVSTKVAGTWKDAQSVYLNVAGVWKKVLSLIPPFTGFTTGQLSGSLSHVTKGTLNVDLYANDGGTANAIATMVSDGGYDLTSVTNLQIDWNYDKSASSGSQNLIVSTEKNGGIDVFNARLQNTGNHPQQVHALNVAALTGLFYIRIQDNVTGGNGVYSNSHVWRVLKDGAEIWNANGGKWI